jgi:penicillin-binding protein 1A
MSAQTEAGDEIIRAIDPRNAFMMDMMLRDVTIYGTAAKASAILKRQDLAGKTGTTNEYVDAWFCGYQITVAGCAWIGFDQPKKLGDKETGGAAALPIWIGYMSRALKDVPVQLPKAPEGLVAFGEGRERNYIYSENVKETPADGEAQEAAPLPKPDFNMLPSD